MIGMKYYQSADTRAKWVYVTFAILALLTLASIISTFAEIDLAHEIEDHHWRVSDSDIQANDDRQAAIAGFAIIAVLGTAIAFLAWIHRAHKNLPSLGADGLRFTPGWAVGWFFIPIMNVVRPYQVTSEIWRASDPEIPAGDAWRTARTSSIVGWWWAINILAGVLSQVAIRTYNRGEDLTELIAADYIYVVSDCVDIIGIIVTIAMVYFITRNQEQRSRVAEMYPNAVADKHVCPNCGREVGASWKVCPNCGEPLVGIAG